MQAAIEISMYPLTQDYRPKIRAFIERLNTHSDLIVRTNALSTQIWGNLARVMDVISREIEDAAGGKSEGGKPQLVFVLKVLPGLAPPTDPVS